MNHDDDSDLTSLDSEDEYASFSAQKGSAKSKKGSAAYGLRKTLTAPRATTYAAQALYDQIHNQDINLDAEYQRDVVWPDTKQISLIDSIFRNFYVPPVIFATKTHEDGSETKVCIDGKQRLTSIRRFMDGLIPYKDSLTAEKLWYKDGGGEKKARSLLPDKLRRLFAGKQIVCVEYQHITENDEREIFQRVQLGMALTPAEKLQVINTPRVGFIRELQNEHVKEGGLSSEHLEWDSSRGADFRCLAQAIWAIDKYSPKLNNIGTIIQLEKWLGLEEELSSDFEGRVADTFRIFSELVQDDKWGKVFKKPAKVSPIEFIVISLLIAVHRTKFTMGQLSSAIGGMRIVVRKEHVDIRMNTRVAKTMIDYIRGLQVADLEADSGAVASQTKRKPGPKRKRANYEDDEDGDDDYAEGSSQSKAKAKKTKPAAPKKSQPAVKKASLPAKAVRPSSTLPPTQLPTSRLAPLRATQAANQNQNPPPWSLSAPPSQPPAFSNLQAAPPQLPSPGQRFTFPSSLSAVTGSSSSYSHSAQQGQSQPPPSYKHSAPTSQKDTYGPNSFDPQQNYGYSTTHAPSGQTSYDDPPPHSAPSASSRGRGGYIDDSSRGRDRTDREWGADRERDAGYGARLGSSAKRSSGSFSAPRSDWSGRR